MSTSAAAPLTGPTADDPAVSAERVRTAVRRVSREPGPLLLALQEVQREFGYIDPAAVPVIANELNVSRAEVHGVLTFYTDFTTKPRGAHHVQICRAEACQAQGARELLTHATAVLGVELGQTTSDRQFSVDQVFCLGNCAIGPAIAIDGRMHGRVNEARFDELLNEVRT